MDRRQTAVVLACVLTISAIGGGRALRSPVPAPTEEVRLERVPYTVGEWVAEDMSVSPRVIEALRSDGLLLREYRNPTDPPVWVYVDYHRRQALGAQVHSPMNCYPGSGWTILETANEEVEARGEARPVRFLHLQRGGEEMLAMYWYESRWGRSARETSLKAGMIRSALSRRSSDAALVRLSTPVGPDGDGEAKRRLLRFLDEGAEHLESELPFEPGGTG